MLKNNRKYLLFTLLTLILSIFLLPSSIYAAKMETGDYTLEKDQIVEDNLYVKGENISINGVVDGDIMVMGGNILLSGTVTGDVYAVGNTITTDGYIYGNVFLVGSNVSTTAVIDGNAYIASTIANTGGNITKDLFIVAGSSKIDGTIGDDVRVMAGQVVSKALVTGDFLVGSDNYDIDINDVQGQVISSLFEDSPTEILKKDNFTFSKNDFLGFNIGLTIIGFLGMYIVGILLIIVAPVKTLQIEKRIISSWQELIKSYLTGLIILFALPIPIILLLVTIVGIPLAILISATVVFLMTFGVIWTESAIGQKVLQLTKYKDKGRFISLLVGRAISVIIKIIPIIRGIYTLSLISITVGAVVRNKYDAFTKLKDRKKTSKPKKK
jgi:hypothetical protein